MILISRRSNKIAGSISFLLGILFIFSLFYSEKLIIDQHSFFLFRYFSIILLGYGGLYGIVFGVLYFIGFLTPYNAANPYDKARTKIWESISGAPIVVLMLTTSSLFLISKEIESYMIVMFLLSCILVVVNIWTLVSALNTCKKFHKK